MEIEEINFDDRAYPNRLKEIKGAPKKLYILGNKEILNDKGIAIVGSRNCSKYGYENAIKFSRNIAKNGFIVISGMAKGIDAAAHLGALEVNGKTIAVLGCGPNYIFPIENKEIYDRILKHGGCIVSEHPINTYPKSEYFRKRNRIISGLSLGVLIIEAKQRSGTLITARYAKEQKKDIFLIPNAIDKDIQINYKIIENIKLVLYPEEITRMY